MEVTYYEDPACIWCWAFEPVATRLAFEFRQTIKLRHVMGGLRDQPPVDVDFTVRQWQKASEISGMPFDTRTWQSHVNQTTFPACRAVKGAALVSPARAARLARRLSEAYFTERIPIDNLDTILQLAAEVGFNPDVLKENIASGRAEEFFTRDRLEASRHGFGFPTTIFSTIKTESAVLLQGTVDYAVILAALKSLNTPKAKRQRFQDVPEDWKDLFKIHPRLTSTEIQHVTGLSADRVAARASQLGLHWTGIFYQREKTDHDTARAGLEAPPKLPGEHEPYGDEPASIGRKLEETDTLSGDLDTEGIRETSAAD